MKFQNLKLMLTVMALALPLFAQAEGLILDSANLNMLEISQAKLLLKEVEGALPAKVKDKLEANPIRLSFRDLGEPLGAYSQWTEQIFVNTVILASDDALMEHKSRVEAGAMTIGHRDPQRLRLATIIHELAHHYDRSHFEKRTIVKKLAGGKIKRKITRDVRTPISEKSWFKNAIGLPTTGFMLNTRTTPEKVERRSMDPYEWKSSAESLAVNIEFFLLDEDYKCNKPFQYELYKDMLAHDPYPTKSCDSPNKVFVLEHALLGANPLVGIDPERLYQLHYFFAGEGKATMSRFGHAMLRLVICKPGREKGPDCLKDISHHLVLSYAALIDDAQISTIKGLKGDYAAVLNVAPLSNMIQKYNETELREIYSYPINIEDEKMEQLLALIQERHWNYSGNYKFLSNNCADETLGFLKSLLYDIPEIANENISRPDTLRDLLAEKGIISTIELEDRAQARAHGYYFPSNRHFYQKGLEHLYTQGLMIDPMEVEDYFESKLSFRKEIIKGALASNDVQNLAYAIALERVIFKKNQINYLERNKAQALDSSREQDSLGEGEFTYLVAPVMMLDPASGEHYGVPSMDEMNALDAKFQQLMKATEEDREKVNALAVAALRDMEEQTDLLRDMLKKLIQLRRKT